MGVVCPGMEVKSHKSKNHNHKLYYTFIHILTQDF